MADKRLIEVFSAGCSVCEALVSRVRDMGCDSCDVVVLDMGDESVSQRARDLGWANAR